MANGGDGDADDADADHVYADAEDEGERDMFGDRRDADPVTRTVERTPHMQAPDRLPWTRGVQFDIEVYANTEGFADAEEGRAIAIELPAQTSSIAVGVLLTTSEHLEVVSSEYQKLKLDADTSESARLSYRLRFVDPEAGDVLAISALFVFAGRSCGHVVRRWTRRDGFAVPSWTDPSDSGAGAVPAGTSGDDTVSVSGEMRVHADAEPPDLTVFVTAPVNDGQHFVCTVNTTAIPGYDPPPVPEQWGLPSRAAEFVRDRLAEFSDPNQTATARKRALVAAGHQFYDAAPAVFKRVLWEMIDQRKAPETIYVASEEPSLPWELMIPSRQTAAGPEEREPLGTEFAIGRWVRSTPIAPEQPLQVARSIVVAPTYSGDRALDASGEILFLTTNFGGRHVTPASIDSLDVDFSKSDATLLHFVCHGEASSDDDSIYLDNDEQLRSSILRALSGFKGLCKKSRPLVFLNSCDAGRLVPSLIGGAGFPRVFGDIGARAIIAPLWPVDDALAHAVAIEIYQRSINHPNETLAEILRDIRSRSYTGAPFQDTFAAYCFYGDPHARLTSV